MIRRVMRWFGWGLLLLTGAMFVAEFVIYGYVRPEISQVKMAIPFVAAALIYFSYKKEKELYNEHLPH
jgi:predicted MFS family arabinose efflux permease